MLLQKHIKLFMSDFIFKNAMTNLSLYDDTENCYNKNKIRLFLDVSEYCDNNYEVCCYMKIVNNIYMYIIVIKFMTNVKKIDI